MDLRLINHDAALLILRRQLNDDLTKAAEPIIQAALAEAERAMRKALAGNLIGLIEHSFKVYERQGHLVIEVVNMRREPPTPEGQR